MTTRVRFDVRGMTLGDMQDQAQKMLDALVGDSASWVLALDVEPEQSNAVREPVFWRAEVTATNPKAYRP